MSQEVSALRGGVYRQRCRPGTTPGPTQGRAHGLDPTLTIGQPVRAGLLQHQLLGREELGLDQLFICLPIPVGHRCLRGIPAAAVLRAHRRNSHPAAHHGDAGGVPVPQPRRLAPLLGSDPYLGELGHRHAHIPARDTRDVLLGDPHAPQVDTHHRHVLTAAPAAAVGGRRGSALKAARAENTDGAAFGGVVVLAPELGTAYLTVKGTGTNLWAALRAASLAPKLSALKPLDGEPLPAVRRRSKGGGASPPPTDGASTTAEPSTVHFSTKGPSVMIDHQLADTIATELPYDGPHSRVTVLDAGESLSALTRYLNNATGPGNGQLTLAWANTVYGLLGYLDSTAYGLDQLLTQLAAALERHADDATLYDDRRDRPASDTVRTAAEQLATAREHACQLADALGQARQLAMHLGND